MLNNRPSFERVDYTVRTAKNIERKMIGEMIGRLRVFRPVENYQYVGLGSTFFSDFVLYHKMFGIKNMVSIEKETTRRGRIEFNKPFGSIEVEFGETTEVLPRLDWSQPSIVWLDYDNRIDPRKLDDLVYLAQNLLSTSVIIVTLPASTEQFSAGQPPDLQRRLDLIRRAVGGRVPDDLQPRNTANLPETLRRISNAAIVDALVARNAAVPPSEKVVYQQVMYFRYADGAPMVTFGGLLLSETDRNRLGRARLRDLQFYRPGRNPYHLQPPKLTFKERRHLDEQFPDETARCPDVRQADVQEYGRLYRYFPAFVEAEI